jgi:hypothetical protein
MYSMDDRHYQRLGQMKTRTRRNEQLGVAFSDAAECSKCAYLTGSLTVDRVPKLSVQRFTIYPLALFEPAL